MSGITLTAARFAHAWVAAYTLGLAASVRDARRAEIRSDVWEEHQDRTAEGRPAWRIAASLLSRIARGAPADILWRTNVEGPKMEINIPFQKIVGGVLLALIVLLLVSTSISGYDTGREDFGSELERLASMSTTSHNVNAFVRAFSGVALIAAAGALYVNLKSRSPLLASMAAFGIAAGGVLSLVAGAMQLVFVELAQEYVSSSGAHQDQVLVTGRAFAMAVENTTGAGFVSLVLSIYALAVLAGREALVPKWMIAIPIISAAVTGGALIAGAAGVDGVLWFFLMGGAFTSILWLLAAGLWLVFSPAEGAKAAPSLEAAAPA